MEKDGTKWQTYVAITLAGIITIAATCYVFYSFFFRRQTYESRPRYNPIPRLYRVNDSYLLPPWDQFDRGTCWAFASVYLLESQYKNQGIQQGQLYDDEYVAFSQEWFAKYMTQTCLNNPKKAACKHTARLRNTSSSGTVENFIKFSTDFPEFQKSYGAVPNSICPYQEDVNLEFYCPSGAESKVKKNPISYKIQNAELAIGIQQVRELFFRVKKPISFSIPNPVERYLFKCGESVIPDDDPQCYPSPIMKCPHDPTSYCAYHDFPFSKPNRSELISRRVPYTIYGTGHAMILVGFNDEFIEPMRFNITGRPPSRGGFILRNSWGQRGHSLGYLMGEISPAQEALLCPNADDVTHWVPADPQDLSTHLYNPTQTSQDINPSGATELQCINSTHCDTGDRYVIKRSPDSPHPVVKITPEGVPITTVIKFNQNDRTHQEIDITSLPFEHLYLAFKALNQRENDMKQCGYVMYMYDAIEAVQQSISPGSGTWRAINIDIVFDKKSYARSKTKGQDYSEVKKSTAEFHSKRAADPMSEL